MPVTDGEKALATGDRRLGTMTKQIADVDDCQNPPSDGVHQQDRRLPVREIFVDVAGTMRPRRTDRTGKHLQSPCRGKG